jgi:hypothetical protein
MNRFFSLMTAFVFLSALLPANSWGQQTVEISTELRHQSVNVQLVETPTAGLPVWREHRGSKPTLVLLSNNPFLQRIPASLKKNALTLTLNGSVSEIERKAVYPSANPTIMSPMAISAALQADFFSRVVWVLPIAEKQPMVSPATIQTQLSATGDISQEEAATVKITGETISGLIRNTPWTISRINSLPEISGPVVLHIDQSYFSALYRNEIKTPLYSILADVINRIQAENWQKLSATVSQSNVSGDISLKTRFFGQDIARLLAEPKLLDENMPELWRKRSQILYLDNLFQQERIKETYLELEKKFPENASVKYGLFDIFGQLKEGNRALNYLEEAVVLDKIYALEYLALADRAQQKGRNQSAYIMLEKASAAFPDDPFITLKKIGTQQKIGTLSHAIDMIKSLRKLSWSPVFDPDMPQFLESLEEQALAEEAEKQPVNKNQ